MKEGYKRCPDDLYRKKIVFGPTLGCQRVTITVRDKNGNFIRSVSATDSQWKTDDGMLAMSLAPTVTEPGQG